jgi:periplasmic protein TonB
MDYARQQRDPAKHAIGIVFVVGMHLLLIWALLSGLGKAVVEVIKKPLSATIVEEIKAPPPPPPPPPPKKIVEAPKVVEVPVEVYVPPPDIPVQAAPAAPVISAVTATPPTVPHVIAPPAPEPPPPPPPKPAIRKDPVRKAGEDIVYPRQAIRAGVGKGRVVARLKIDEKGNVYDVEIVSADPPRHFDRAVIDGVKDWKYAAEGAKYVAEIEVIFVLKE